MNLSSRKIFISHSPYDSEVASSLGMELARDGYQVLLEDFDSHNTSKQASSIFASIESASALIVILSAESIQDENVKRQLNLAIDKKLILYPINFSGDEIKKLLTPEWRYWLGITQILSCNDIIQASRTLRFRIPADSAAALSESLPVKESIKGAWRTFEAIFEEIGEAKLNHIHLDFAEIHQKFQTEVVPGFSQYAAKLESSSLELKVENRFAGKMLYGLFNYLQYFDCHSLTLNRSNSCGLRGHEIETLVDNYIQFSACNFQYPSAISWYAESQFLWNFEHFLESSLPLLSEEIFPISIEILKLDFERLYASYAEDDLMVEGLDYKPGIGLREHIFDHLAKCIFYRNAPLLSDKVVIDDKSSSAKNSIDKFLLKYAESADELKSAAAFRERFQMDGYPMLLLLRAFILQTLGKPEESSKVIEEICDEDLRTLNQVIPRKIEAAEGIGRDILVTLWAFLCEHVDFGETSDEFFNGNFNENFQSSDFEQQSFSVAEQLFLLGVEFDESGDVERAMDLWSRAARAGVISALSSFTWASLHTNDFQSAIDLYEECIDIPSDSVYDLEKMNSTGNYILNLLAKDKDYSAAIGRFNTLVKEAGANPLVEASLSLVTLEFLYGDKERTEEILSWIPKEELVKLEQSYERETLIRTGWLKEWCTQVLEVIAGLSK